MRGKKVIVPNHGVKKALKLLRRAPRVIRSGPFTYSPGDRRFTVETKDDYFAPLRLTQEEVLHLVRLAARISKEVLKTSPCRFTTPKKG